MGYLRLYLKDLGGGQRAYLDVPSYDDEGSNDGYIWSEANSVTGYIAVTTFADFYTLGAMDLGAADFIAKKDYMKSLIVALGSGNEDDGVDALPNSEQKIYVCSNLIGSYTKRVTVFGGDFDAMNNATTPYNLYAISCRKNRFNRMVPLGHTYIPQYMGVILSEIGSLDRAYIEYGIKGQSYDPPQYPFGLSNYFNSLPPFDGIETVPYLGTTCNGLSTKGWTCNDGRPITDLVAQFNDIMFEGGVR